MMKNNLKNIFDIKKVSSLTKVLCKEYIEKLPIFKAKDSSQGKIFKICLIIAIVGLAYISYYIIDLLKKIGMTQIFLNIYLLIIAILIMIQQILASTDIYYYSEDLEYLLPFPFNPIELLISRFNMLVTISYGSIAMFALIPLIIYGLMVARSLLYFLGLIIVLLIFPIFFALIISSLMLFVMQLAKIIKNKDIFQFIVTFIFMFILFTFGMLAINMLFNNIDEIVKIEQGENINLIETINNKIIEINNYLLTINPSVKILTENNILKNIINLLKIIIINLIAFITFILIGKKLYLKNILINIQKINSKKIKNKKIKNKYKKISKEKAYIKNEFKQLIKNPTFFMQCILPIILIILTVIAIAIAVYPSVSALLQGEELLQEFKFDLNILITIIILLQIIFTFSNLSITAISRKGKKAFFIKYIPISFYKQFLLLNLPQILFNIFISLIILLAVKILIQEISIIYLIIMFVMSVLINIINSFLMLVVDLRRPNLEWDNETDAIKQNKNKLYQYVFTIIIILFLVYLKQILEKINFNLAIFLILFILIIILLLINKIIKNKINKLFNKIN